MISIKNYYFRHFGNFGHFVSYSIINSSVCMGEVATPVYEKSEKLRFVKFTFFVKLVLPRVHNIGESILLRCGLSKMNV